jgi:hypothetical protein
MRKEFRKDVTEFGKSKVYVHPFYMKTNEYYGRKIRNAREAESMEFAEMLSRDNEEGWPYDDRD